MVREHGKLQEKDNTFYTYERNYRKHPHAEKGQTLEENDKAQQYQYYYLQALEEHEEIERQKEEMENEGPMNEKEPIISEKVKEKTTSKKYKKIKKLKKM